MADSDDKWERLARLNQKPSKRSTDFDRPSSHQPTVNLKLLALGYVMLTYSIVAEISLIVLPLILGTIGVQLPDIAMSMWGLLFLVSALFVLASLLIIAVASKTILSAVLICLSFLIPCVYLIVVIWTYLDAKETLQRNGVKIGFFGVDFESIQ